jgi:hypothetical protein
MQITTTLRFHLTLVRRAAIKNTDTKNASEMWQKKESCTLMVWECKLVHSLWKSVWRFIKKLNTDLHYHPAIGSVHQHSRETPAHPCLLSILHNSHVVKSVQVTNNWCLDKENVVYIHKADTIFTNSATKQNEMPFAEKWMQLEIIILNEISQAWKVKYCMFSLICGI